MNGANRGLGSLHKYAYCHANPVNGIDPSIFEVKFLDRDIVGRAL